MILYNKTNAPVPSRYILDTTKAIVERHTEKLSDADVIQAMKESSDYYDYRKEKQAALAQATSSLLISRYPKIEEPDDDIVI